MKEISKIIEGMMEDAKRLIDESKRAVDEQNNWRNAFFARSNNVQDNTLKIVLNTLAIQHGDDAILHSKIRQTVRLSEMNMILTDALNRAFEKMEKEFPERMAEIKNELSSEVEENLKPIHEAFQEEKKQDKEINKLAKDREKHIGDMFG